MTAQDKVIRAAEALVEAFPAYGAEAVRQGQLAGDPQQQEFRFPTLDRVASTVAAVEALLTDDAIPQARAVVGRAAANPRRMAQRPTVIEP